MAEKENNTHDILNFELFFELTADLLCIAGYDGYFRRINPAVSKLLGYTNEELLARPIHEFIHPDDKDLTARHRYSLIRDKPLLNFENRYVSKSGEIVWLSWTSIPVEKDKIVYAIAKNITHKKQLEANRNLAIAELTKINQDLKLLTYKTSHDLQAPVNNLLAVFDLLDPSKIQHEETIIFIDLLKAATHKLKETLNNYVTVLSHGNQLQVPIEEIDLNECLNGVLQSLSSLMQSSKCTVKVNFAEPDKIKFNKAYLESIFLNLITNSIKYARPDCLPEISIYSRKAHGINQLIFADEGMGFEMDKVKDRIF